MGLCTSKSTVTLDPRAQTLRAQRASQAAAEGVSPEGTPTLDEGILMVQPLKNKAEGGGGRGGAGGGGGAGAGGGRETKGSRIINQTAKGYMELGGEGGGEAEAQTSQEAEEAEEDESGDQVEELINFSDSEGSSTSDFVE